jgi:glutaredoxin
LRVTLYTKVGCGLCEEAEDVLRKARKLIRFDLDLVYIEDDPTLLTQYQDRVPVVVVDGEEMASPPLDQAALLAAISTSG